MWVIVRVGVREGEPLKSSLGFSWNRVGNIGVSGRERARARKRERTRKSVVTRPEGKA